MFLTSRITPAGHQGLARVPASITLTLRAIVRCSSLRRRLQAAGEQGREVDADVVLIDLTSLLSPAGRFHQWRPGFSIRTVPIAGHRGLPRPPSQ